MAIAKLAHHFLKFGLQLISLGLLLNFKLLILKKMMGMQGMRVRIVHFVLTHVMSFEFHILNCTLCSQAHVNIVVELCHELLIIAIVNLLVEFVDFIL